jgi:hypothetical protein
MNGLGVRPVPSAAELERKSLIELAVLCGNVAVSPSADKGTVDKAHALRLEWVRLNEPPNPVFEEQQKVEAQQESLKKRMVEFLAVTLNS